MSDVIPRWFNPRAPRPRALLSELAHLTFQASAPDAPLGAADQLAEYKTRYATLIRAAEADPDWDKELFEKERSYRDEIWDRFHREHSYERLARYYRPQLRGVMQRLAELEQKAARPDLHPGAGEELAAFNREHAVDIYCAKRDARMYFRPEDGAGE